MPHAPGPLALLRQLSWPEWRHHALRQLMAVLAVMLGVALAFSVQLINASALSEFGSAVRSVNGEPDLVLRGGPGGFDEALYARVAAHPLVGVASPVVEIDTYVLDAAGARQALRVLGLDALVAPALSPALLPQADAGAGRLALLDPALIFLNPAARQALGARAGDTLRLQSGLALQALTVGGGITAPGAPLAVMDIAGAQARFGRLGRLSRIDLRLAAGADPAALLRDLALPAGVRAATPDEATQRLSNVSRAYRVNLTVLALVALFTGAFLVFSILSLSVAKRQPQFALLGVLGLDARSRLRLVLAESALLGLAGSALGLLLGTGLAALALRWLGGDLGGGYFQRADGAAPALQFDAAAALIYGALGVVAAMAGGWLPARAAQRLAPAQALKGLGSTGPHTEHPWLGLALIAAAALLALAPPIAGLPIAAYVAVALLLVGGIACVPAGVGLLLKLMPTPTSAPALLAVERARRQRSSATVAVAGVVTSLSLAVALTVMVASFREAVSRWLDVVLPADLYVRTASSGGSSGDAAWLPPDFVLAASRLDGVVRSDSLRATPLPLDPARPAPVLIARPLADPARSLPLTGNLLDAPPGERAAYVSEAMVTLYGAKPGMRLALPLTHTTGRAVPGVFFVRGVWRDYARQQGAVVVADTDYRALTGDTRVNDLALHLAPGADVAALQRQLRALAPDPALVEFAQAGEIRAISLRIFDRSFAVTYWLQAVAIAIGLFGIAASFSAQVLARRREFGLLAHLGFTRRQVLAIVAGEAAAWTVAGALLGLALGVAVSVVLVHVVNPQSFHWTMELLLPWLRLAMLCAAVVLAGTVTAAVAARRAASRDAVLAVKEDW
ncbi:ABC transporter permease [uncultured Methylibium sp.]|uniref:FtsX-like permease family protein n=1 Tax=uncultured Methylibium sp. TaxID=381093 RepID=UPI0025E7A6AB|nr:ABC transporter permease [uncultured Methylibium sp.]